MPFLCLMIGQRRTRGTVLHGKIILKIQLIENKEVTLFVQLNW